MKRYLSCSGVWVGVRGGGGYRGAKGSLGRATRDDVSGGCAGPRGVGHGPCQQDVRPWLVVLAPPPSPRTTVAKLANRPVSQTLHTGHSLPRHARRSPDRTCTPHSHPRNNSERIRCTLSTRQSTYNVAHTGSPPSGKEREREVGGGGGERRAGGAPSHTSLEHFRHVTRPTSGAKYPPEHSSQWEEPVVEACRPTEQFVHVAAAAPDRVPASQLVQIELPAKPEYLGERGVTGEWGASDATDGRRDLARAAARKEVVGRVGGGCTSLPPPLVLSRIAVGARGGGGPAVRSRAASGTIDGEAL